MMELQKKAFFIGASIWIGPFILFTIVIGLISSYMQSIEATPTPEVTFSTEKKTEEKKNSKKVVEKTIHEVKSNSLTLWVIQVSSYTKKKYAEELIRLLEEKNYQPSLFTQKKGKKTIYAVRLKPYYTKEEAQTVVKKIEQQLNLIPIIIYINKSER